MYYVYIIQSEKDKSFYIGSTSNINNRIREHNYGNTRYTKHKRPWGLLYTEEFPAKSSAIKREKYLKRLKNKKYLEGLIRKSRELTGL